MTGAMRILRRLEGCLRGFDKYRDWVGDSVQRKWWLDFSFTVIMH
jgi:hypothetical protein